MGRGAWLACGLTMMMERREFEQHASRGSR